MRVMVLVKSTANGDTDFVRTPWTDAMLEAMGRFNATLAEAGILIVAEGLKPSRCGKRIAFDGEHRTVIDGPFPEPATLVAGYWLWQVRDMDEAVAWAKRCPNPMPEACEIEIRPLHEAPDPD
ncbi:YciI family protein [Uliginosibacterium paludis]|uniref:YciI family protein n=1 Tax=Uliginosibacterium paludis TaxID=1615952 RepID=UPI0031F65996